MTDASIHTYFPDTGFEAEYPRLNTELHPIVPPRLRVGALNWYTAAWLTTAIDAQTTDRAAIKAANEGRAEAIDDALLEICRVLLLKETISEVKINGVSFKTNQDVLDTRLLSSKIMADGSRKTLETDEHNRFRHEVFSVSFIHKKVMFKLHIASHQEYFTTNYQAEFADVSPADYNSANKYLEILARRGEYDEPMINYIYDGFWDEASKLLGNCQTALLGSNKFADFRGVVITKAPPDGVAASGRRSQSDDRYSAAESVRLTRSMMPFMESAAQPSEHPEFSAATFLDRRVIYISALGARPTATANNTRPVRYLILSRSGTKAETRNRWQIGRLIDRLNTLGTYRLAALRDLQHLNAASIEVREIGGKLQALSDNDHSMPPDDRELQQQHVGLYRTLNTIGQRCEGGFAYRIERSRFYVASLQRLIPDLRSHRIEGFQPYDEFVRRRLASTYDFIDRLGVRIERARTRLDSLNGELRTSQQVEQTREQTRLLRFAELVTLVPVVHYGSEIVKNYYDGTKPEFDLRWVPLDIAFAYMVCIWVIKPAASFIYSLYEDGYDRWIKTRQKRIYDKDKGAAEREEKKLLSAGDGASDRIVRWQNGRWYRVRQAVAGHLVAVVLSTFLVAAAVTVGLMQTVWSKPSEHAAAKLAAARPVVPQPCVPVPAALPVRHPPAPPAPSTHRHRHHQHRHN